MFCMITLSRSAPYCIVLYCTAWDITILLHCIYGVLRYSINPHNSNYAVLHCPVGHQLRPAKPRTADAFCKQQSNVFSQSHQAVWNHDGSASDERLPGGSGRDWVLTDVNRVRDCASPSLSLERKEQEWISSWNAIQFSWPEWTTLFFFLSSSSFNGLFTPLIIYLFSFFFFLGLPLETSGEECISS